MEECELKTVFVKTGTHLANQTQLTFKQAGAI